MKRQGQNQTSIPRSAPRPNAEDYEADLGIGTLAKDPAVALGFWIAQVLIAAGQKLQSERFHPGDVSHELSINGDAELVRSAASGAQRPSTATCVNGWSALPEHWAADDALLTAGQVASILNVKRKAIYEMRSRGNGPVATMINRQVRFSRRHLQDWMDARRSQSTSDRGGRS
jgi:predicted DNA-binding transcriptional regulator AlpA